MKFRLKKKNKQKEIQIQNTKRINKTKKIRKWVLKEALPKRACGSPSQSKHSPVHSRARSRRQAFKPGVVADALNKNYIYICLPYACGNYFFGTSSNTYHSFCP